MRVHEGIGIRGSPPTLRTRSVVQMAVAAASAATLSADRFLASSGIFPRNSGILMRWPMTPVRGYTRVYTENGTAKNITQLMNASKKPAGKSVLRGGGVSADCHRTGGLKEHVVGADSELLPHGRSAREGVLPPLLPGRGVGLPGIDEHGPGGGGGREALAAVLHRGRCHLERGEEGRRGGGCECGHLLAHCRAFVWVGEVRGI